MNLVAQSKELSTLLRNGDSVLSPKEKKGPFFYSLIVQPLLQFETQQNAIKIKSFSKFYLYLLTNEPFTGSQRIEENCLCLKKVRLLSFLKVNAKMTAWHTNLNKATEGTWTGSFLYPRSRRFSPWRLGHRLFIKLRKNKHFIIISPHHELGFYDNQ